MHHYSLVMRKTLLRTEAASATVAGVGLLCPLSLNGGELGENSRLGLSWRRLSDSRLKGCEPRLNRATPLFYQRLSCRLGGGDCLAKNGRTTLNFFGVGGVTCNNLFALYLSFRA